MIATIIFPSVAALRFAAVAAHFRFSLFLFPRELRRNATMAVGKNKVRPI